MSIVYCNKCHKEAYRLVQKDDNVQVIQNGRSIFNLKPGSVINATLTCPNNHPVKLCIKPEEDESCGPSQPSLASPS